MMKCDKVVEQGAPSITLIMSDFSSARLMICRNSSATRGDWSALSSRLAQLADHPYAVQLERVLSARGQAFLLQASEAMPLRYQADRDVVNALLNALAAYFSSSIASDLLPVGTISRDHV